MKFIETDLKEAFVIELDPIKDERGIFVRTFCKKEFEQIGHHQEFVQLNHSFNIKKGTLRGMHYQRPPFEEIKLIRCVCGRVYDVIVDIRKNSPTFLQYVGIELSEKNQKMVYIPKGFAHGFQTLEADTQLLYHHTEFYNPMADAGINHADKKINIAWKLPISVISKKDSSLPFINEDFIGI
jgi:dTDP-4-dehydrorhamnose 3,5-epimerase